MGGENIHTRLSCEHVPRESVTGRTHPWNIIALQKKIMQIAF